MHLQYPIIFRAGLFSALLWAFGFFPAPLFAQAPLHTDRPGRTPSFRTAQPQSMYIQSGIDLLAGSGAPTYAWPSEFRWGLWENWELNLQMAPNWADVQPRATDWGLPYAGIRWCIRDLQVYGLGIQLQLPLAAVGSAPWRPFPVANGIFHLPLRANFVLNTAVQWDFGAIPIHSGGQASANLSLQFHPNWTVYGELWGNAEGPGFNAGWAWGPAPSFQLDFSYGAFLSGTTIRYFFGLGFSKRLNLFQS